MNVLQKTECLTGIGESLTFLGKMNASFLPAAPHQKKAPHEKPSAPVKTKRIGVAEIAKAAGVSPAAVSSLLCSADGKGRVSEKTRLSIIRACRDLDYHPPNSTALNRIYPELGDYCFALSSEGHMGFHDPYYSQLLKAVTDAVPSADDHLHLCRFTADQDYLAQPKSLPLPIRTGVATKIFCAGQPNLSFLEALSKRGMPIVYLGQEISMTSVVCVVADIAAGVRSAIHRLVELGHKRIAAMVGPFTAGSSGILRQRAAFEAAMAEHNVPVRSEYLQFFPLSPEGGASAVEALMNLPQPPTALYCFNDTSAIGAIQHADSRNVRVPEDLSIIGYDDIWLSQTITPPLTTIHVPLEEMARCGVEEIERMTREGIKPVITPRLIVLPTHLIERKSTSSVNISLSR